MASNPAAGGSLIVEFRFSLADYAYTALAFEGACEPDSTGGFREKFLCNVRRAVSNGAMMKDAEELASGMVNAQA